MTPADTTEPASPDVDFLDAVRGFNRFYTNKLGLLSKGYLDTDYTLTEARILYEVGARQRVSATELNRDLGLDPAISAAFSRSSATTACSTASPIRLTDAAKSYRSPTRDRRSMKRLASAPGARSPTT